MIPSLTAKDKHEVLPMIKDFIRTEGLHISEANEEKPWGAYYRFEDADINLFLSKYFSHKTWHAPNNTTLSPKFLVIAPLQRLSWQYHHRRAEHWRVLAGPVKVTHSINDSEPEPTTLREQEFIDFQPETRHRLIGTDTWGVVAEIWQHTDQNNLSDESDIVHLQDDYGR